MPPETAPESPRWAKAKKWGDKALVVLFVGTLASALLAEPFLWLVDQPGQLAEARAEGYEDGIRDGRCEGLCEAHGLPRADRPGDTCTCDPQSAP